MIRLSAIYPATDGQTFDDAYYFGKHHELCVARLKPEGMVSCEFDKGLSDASGGKPPYIAIAHLVFNSIDDFQKAMAKHGQEIMADIPNYTKIQPVLQISEITSS
jgi:uncharacterized protein (TIGR02118 family)